MSSYKDINQLFDEIATSARSAGDPWSITRTSHGSVSRNPFSPAVVADMGAPAGALASSIAASERVTQADVLAPSPNPTASENGASSGGSGLLGGLLHLFPLASGIADLFGLGGGDSPEPALTPYQLPPSISFQGAMGSGGNVTSLSYGSDGLARATPSSPVQNTLGELNTLGGNKFAPAPSAASPNFGSTVPTTAAAVPAEASPAGDGSAESGSFGRLSGQDGGTQPASQGHSILVQVQAMDSQSFMDRSHDIARAVRQAMLNLHSVNDVILDL